MARPPAYLDVPESPATFAQKWTALAVICACQFIYLMDVFLLNVSAPEIMAEFNNPAVLKGVFAANQIAFASFVFLGGRLGDLFGRRRLFVLGLFGAGLSALLAGRADTAGLPDLTGPTEMLGSTVGL